MLQDFRARGRAQALGYHYIFNRHRHARQRRQWSTFCGQIVNVLCLLERTVFTKSEIRVDSAVFSFDLSVKLFNYTRSCEPIFRNRGTGGFDGETVDLHQY